MNRRALLTLILAALPLPAPATAKPAVWTGARVVVRDYTGDRWRPHVAPLVAAFNQALPRAAPRLVYRAAPVRPCAQVAMRPREIAICEQASPASTEGADYVTLAHTIVKARIALGDGGASETAAHRANTLCHELMHALSNIPDAYDMPRPLTSCVHGEHLTAPGAFDRRYLRRVYRRHARQQRKARRRK